jgi:hypothetical protein
MGKAPKLKTTTLDLLVVRERAMFVNAEKRLGHPYRVAREATLLMTTFLQSVSGDRFVFANFMGIIKNHLTLALLSMVRRHHVEAMMNIRQVLESASNAAYALANPDADWAHPTTGRTHTSQVIRERSFKWMDANFKAHSDTLSDLKRQLNETDLHSNIVNGSRSFQADPDAGVMLTNFFDDEDLHIIHSDLMVLSLVAMCTMHLLHSVAERHGGFVISKDWRERADLVEADRQRITAAIGTSDRHQAALARKAEFEAAKAERAASGRPKKA